MKSMFNKEVLRSIRHSLGRFVAIAAITALGTGFYAGLRMVAPDMNHAADVLFDETSLMDIRVVGTFGLNDANIKAISDIQGVETVTPAYETDIMGTIGDSQYTIRVHSYNPDSPVNKLTLTEGSWPTSSGECVISADRVMKTPVNIGDKIDITLCSSNLDSTLKVHQYTVVGKITSSYYASSINLGVTSLGSGSVEQYIYVPESDFSSSYPYTEAFVQVRGAQALIPGSDEYKQRVAKVVEALEEIGGVQSEAREADVRAGYASAINNGYAELDREKDSVNDQLSAAKKQLDKAQSGIEQLQSGISELETIIAQVHTLVEAHVYTEEREAELREQLEGYKEQLASAQEAYNNAYNEYRDAVIASGKSFAEAEATLKSAKSSLGSVSGAQWYVLDRTKNYGVESFASDAQRIDNIASFFPFIFFLVAALVCLTTMTRMIDEERVLIGTYKALGYSQGRIASKYIFYAASASVIGSVIGIAIMSQLLPAVIMYAYDIIYSVPAAGYLIDWPIAILSGGLGLAITLIATCAAVFSTLRENSAQLMLPRAPKAGKRILLERVKPVWSRLSFSWKVTCRNLFRYKKRFIMTIIGIAGCTALLLTGWGLRDSINDIIDKHFGGILQYNAAISLEEDMSAGSQNELEIILNDEQYVTGWMRTHGESVIVKRDGANDIVVGIAVPEDTETYKSFMKIQDRISQQQLDLNQTGTNDAGETMPGVVLTEKCAKTIGKSIGDTVRFYKSDAIGNATTEYSEYVITGIMEAYIGNSAFMSSENYQMATGVVSVFQRYIVNVANDEDVREEFAQRAWSIDGVKTVGYNDELISEYREMIKSVDLIVWVLVIAAAGLAFIVLYNLTNINITERIREVATLKVLGFTLHEVNVYIYRETILLTLIGAILGLVLGVVLEGFVITTAEVDQVMFGRDIHLFSYVISFVLTLLFSVFVMLAMKHKLKSVDMVESLKSVD